MITFGQVSKRYPDGTVALDRLSMVAPTGQVTVLAGASGRGKTTALRMVNRMIELTSGRVLIDGTDVRSRKPAELWRGIGYVIQQIGLFRAAPCWTAADRTPAGLVEQGPAPAPSPPGTPVRRSSPPAAARRLWPPCTPSPGSAPRPSPLPTRPPSPLSANGSVPSTSTAASR